MLQLPVNQCLFSPSLQDKLKKHVRKLTFLVAFYINAQSLAEVVNPIGDLPVSDEITAIEFEYSCTNRTKRA